MARIALRCNNPLLDDLLVQEKRSEWNIVIGIRGNDIRLGYPSEVDIPIYIAFWYLKPRQTIFVTCLGVPDVHEWRLKYNSSPPIHGSGIQIAYLEIDINRHATKREKPVYEEVSER